MKKILIIHTEYRTKSGEYQAFLNDLAELKKKFEVKSINLTNKDFKPFTDTFNILFNRNKELVKHFNELETSFKPDYYYFHNTWFKAAGIVTYLLKADRFVILKLHNFRFDCIQGSHYRKNKLCFKCSRSPFFGILNKCYRNSIIMSLIISLFTHRFRKSLLHPNIKVLALNSFQYNYLLDFGVKNENLLLQYNFLENNNVAINSKYRNKKKEFVYLGRLTESKGTIELMECFNDLNREDYILNIIGENDNSISFEKYKNSKNIIFHGYQESSFINQKLKSSLAVISATKSLELHPMIINESVKNKCLLIFPDIPGLLDFFPQNYEFIYKHSNYKNLKLTINSLIEKYENNPELLDKQIDILSSHINDLLDPDKLIRNFMVTGNE